MKRVRYVYYIARPDGKAVEWFDRKSDALDNLRFWSDRLGLKLTVKREKAAGNPSRRSAKKRETKAERLMRQQRERQKRERANAASRLLKTMNPASKTVAVRVQRLKGGGVKLTPVKVKHTR